MTIDSRKLILGAVLSLCSLMSPLGPVLDHGLGFLQRVRNNSEYPINFAQEKTILDYLPDGTVFRIKSLRKEYGPQGRYYAVRKIVGAYRLEADTFDPDDSATHFVIKRFVSRDFTEYIGIYSDFAEGMFLKTDDSRAATFSMQDIMDDKSAEGHWTIADLSGDGNGAIDARKFMDPNFAANVFNACYLKSRVSGYLQSRGTPQNYPGLEKIPVNKYANPILDGTESSTSSSTTKAPGAQNTSDAPQNSANTQPPAASSPNTPGAAAGAAQPASSPTAVGTVTQISAERSTFADFIDASTAVIIKQNGSVAQQKSDGSWETLDGGLTGAAFTSLAAGDDGTLWGCDVNNNVWSFDISKSAWSKIALAPSTSALSKISLGNAGNIWALSRDGVLFQRIQDGDNTSWKIPNQAIGVGAIRDVCVTPDGTVFVLGGDNKIYRGLKSESGYSFNQYCIPSELVGMPATSIAAGSRSSVAFSTPTNEVFVLVTGKPGNSKDSWKKLTLKDQKTPIKLRSFSVFKNGSLVGTIANSGSADDSSVALVSDITTS